MPQIKWASRILEGTVFPFQKRILMLHLFNSCNFDINTHCYYSEIFKNSILHFKLLLLGRRLFYPLNFFVYIMGLVSHKLNLKTTVLLGSEKIFTSFNFFLIEQTHYSQELMTSWKLAVPMAFKHQYERSQFLPLYPHIFLFTCK